MKEIKKKIQPKYFKEVAEGKKDFEIRKDDSDYEVGDILILQEIESTPLGMYFTKELYTGNEIAKRIKYKITHEEFPDGIQEGYCILGLEQELSDVYIHIVEFQAENLKGIPVPCAFSSYENLTKFEESLMFRKDVKTLNITRCEIDKHIESEN